MVASASIRGSGTTLVVIEQKLDIPVDGDYLVELILQGGSDSVRILFEGS